MTRPARSILYLLPGSIALMLALIFPLHNTQAVTIVSIKVEQDMITPNSPTSQSSVAGSAVAQPPSVKITDAFGNPASGVDVTFTITGGEGSITGDGNVTSGPDGIAAIGGWTLGAIAGANTMTAVNAGYAGSPVTFTATGTSGEATKVVLTRQSAGTASGSAFTTQPQVTIQDAAGNTVSSSTARVTATISDDGTLVGTTTAIATAGVATFTNLGIAGKAGTAYTITYTVSNLDPANQIVTVTPGLASKLAITRQPSSSTVSKAPFAVQPEVTIQDAEGNAMTDATNAITLTLSTGTGKLDGMMTMNAVAGVADFSGNGLNIDLAGADKVLTASAVGLTAAATNAFAITAGPASQIEIVTQPGGNSVVSGTMLAGQPEIKVSDEGGNGITGVTVTATLEGAYGTLTNNTAITDDNGKATFTELTFTSTFATASPDYTIKFSYDTISVTSGSVTHTLAVGKPYQGGYIAYLGSPFTTGLIAAQRDLGDLQWGGFGTLIGTGGGLGEGKVNTERIVVQLANNPGYAAGACDSYSVTEGGVTYDDWYLPSRDELHQLYQNLHNRHIGGFAPSGYWSSTEDGAGGGAWTQNFDNGSQYGDYKGLERRVRPVRAF
ncbi:Lcl domain-containing protein [Chlorobium phaeobacteroides]|uniref:Lcl C-terminal domain-containing protein n=1 Tax=Chlorobium phaeobacteroides (strain DSM 266 / SMG 266 / 2430) TaxID=290317 RepID=A1BFL5_CHLPD|nr:DUF1566 domain-containing protein [Chlorobium phaeobacteroides]ABL65192.1 hypothetical protein Cpha266_1155 [Chlorobium phaeobacteroides DSM 266]